MYISPFLKMTIEEEMGEMNNQEKNNLPNGEEPTESLPTETADDTAPNTHVTANVEEIGMEPEIEADQAKETDPLKSGACADIIVEDECVPHHSKMSMEELEEGEGGASRRKSFDRKCAVLGVLLLLVIVAGAIGAVFINKFSTKVSYSFRFDRYFADGMVLQRAPQRAVVFGSGPLVSGKNATVILTLEGAAGTTEYSTHVEPTVSGGKWTVVLDPVSEAGPFTIKAKLEKEKTESIEIKDVLFGDVWLCAGQKNMHYTYQDMLETMSEAEREEALAGLDHLNQVRVLALRPNTNFNFAASIEYPLVTWSTPSRESGALRFSALCLLFGQRLRAQLGAPVGLVSATHYSSSIEDWIPPEVVNTCSIDVAHETSTVYKPMIRPLQSTSIYGVIWYQGENDAEALSTPLYYGCALINLLTSWRAGWYEDTQGATHPRLPFGIVQLGAPRNATNLTTGYQDIRWQQTANYGYLPNPALQDAFLVTALDLPLEPDGVTARQKAILADRLVSGAVDVAYRQGAVGSGTGGPLPDRYAAFNANSSLVLVFDRKAVESRATEGFEVCCASNRGDVCPVSVVKAIFAPGREWVPARVQRHTPNSVTLSFSGHEACGPEKHVTAWRYLWREAPCAWQACPVYEAQSGLPMPPFIKQGLVDNGRYREVDRLQTNQTLA